MVSQWRPPASPAAPLEWKAEVALLARRYADKHGAAALPPTRIACYQTRSTGTQDGFTFLQVYNMTDMGGVNWVGPALNADQLRQHIQRKARLLAMLNGVID